MSLSSAFNIFPKNKRGCKVINKVAMVKSYLQNEGWPLVFTLVFLENKGKTIVDVSRCQ